MARTIIGQLIIKLQEQGARAAAKSLTTELDSIERRARALGRVGGEHRSPINSTSLGSRPSRRLQSRHPSTGSPTT